MSKSLLKLLDNSIFPACIMILGKLVGVLFALWFFDIPYSLRDYFSAVYSLRFVVPQENIQTVTSYSDLVMYVIMALFFSLVLIRALFLHSTHVTPSLITKLANSNLLKLVQSSYEIYHTATVWLVFMIIANVLVLINVFRGSTYAWIGVVCTIVSVLLTVILLHDVYREIESIKKKPSSYLLN